MTSCDVLVVGAGPTGLTSASELARHGHRPRIIDKAATPCAESRAFAVHARTMELFENIGVVESILAGGRPARALTFYEGAETIVRMEISSRIPSKYPFVQIIAQSDTERVLTEHLRGFGIEVERGVELLGLSQDEGGVEARLGHAGGREETVRCRYLIGNDGAHSVVRKELGIEFSGAPYPNQWLLADIDLEWARPYDELSVCFHRSGTTAFFPLDGRRGRLMFEVTDAPTDEPQAEPTLADVERLCHARDIPFASIANPKWLAWFRLHHRMVDRYSVGRVFIGGDAAHIHSPIGGQGMNMGIQDAYNLAWKLALVLDGHAAPSLLHSYHVERHRVDREIVVRTDRATRIATIHNPVFDAIRRQVLKVMTRFDSVRGRILGAVSQVELHYRRSPIVAEVWRGPKSDLRPGERVPDFPLVRDRDGEPGVLYDLLTGAEHELLLLCGEAPDAAELAALREVARRVAARLGSLVELHLVHAGARPPGAPEVASSWADPELAMHRAFGARGASLVLIRPDGYVGFRNQPADPDALSGYLDTIFSGVAAR